MPWKKAVVWVLVLYSLMHVCYSIGRYNPLTYKDGSGDFHTVYKEAVELKRTGALSSLTAASVQHPLFYYMVLGSFSGFEFKTVVRFFYFIQFFLFPIALWFLVQAIPKDATSFLGDYGLAALLAVNFQPFLETLAQHKVEGIEFFLVCGAIYALSRRRDFLAGMILCLAANLKYLPGILILYAILKRETKVLWGAAAAAGVLLGILLMVFGLERTMVLGIQHPLALLMSPRLESNFQMATPVWQSLNGVIYRWFAQPEPPLTLHDYIRFDRRVAVSQAPIVFWLPILLKAVFCGVYLFSIRKNRRPPEKERACPSYLLEISLTLAMIPIVVQGMRVSYGILVLPAFVMTGLLLYRRRVFFRWPEKILFVLAYGLSALIIPGGLLNRLPPHPVWGEDYARLYMWFGLPFWGYLVLFFCILFCYRRVEGTRP